MDNRILHIDIHDHVLAAAAAEVHIAVRSTYRTSATELRGRLTGPRCPFSSTVEVAYPLRPLPTPAPLYTDELVARVIIPEASLWDPQSPFLYGGPIELWQDGCRCDVMQVRHGLRLLQIGPSGLRVNGRPQIVHGKYRTTACSDDEALQMRRAGYNLLVAPVTDATVSLWDISDRFGFLVIGQVDVADTVMRKRLDDLRRHSSCLGWLTRDSAFTGKDVYSSDVLELLGPLE